jgi:hypothetical protein
MIQPWVAKDNAWLSQVSNKEHLDSVPFSLVDSQFDVLLNDSSLVFHPIHIIDFSWAWEKHCLDLEFFGESPVNEIFGSSTVN